MARDDQFEGEGEDNDEDASVNDDEAVHVTDRMIMAVSLLGD